MSEQIGARRQAAAAATPDRNALPRRLRTILSLNDFEAPARKYLPRSIFAFVSSGSQDEITLNDNRKAFDDYRLVPRVLVGVANRTQQTTLFGEAFASPFGIAPMGSASLLGYRADLEMAAACEAANIPFIQSGASLIRLEDVRAACRTAWFQAYIPAGDKTGFFALIDRVKAAGFQTLVLTVDMTAGSNHEKTIRARFSTPFRPSFHVLWEGITHPRWALGSFLRTIIKHGVPHFENLDGGRGPSILDRKGIRDKNRAGHTWDTVSRVREYWRGNLVLKGLLHPDDVAKAASLGVDGVIVSTHGGRQIDGAIPALHALPGCVAAAGEMPVMIDSGIRRGTDVIKCFALGAKFVFVGRPFNFAAAVAGRAGVTHAITLLKNELGRDMGNMGINSVDDIGHKHIVERWQRS